MALRLSTAMRNNMLNTDGIKSTFNTGKINIYSGTQPASADDAVPADATLLCTFTVNGGGTGITFDAPASGTISKAAAETWQGTAVASGTAGWFRLFKTGDDPSTLSTSLARIDGNVATSGGNMNISNTSIVDDAVQTISEFEITLPAS